VAPHSFSHQKGVQNILNQENHGNCLLEMEGIFVVDFMPQQTTINATVYFETQKRLRCAIQNRRGGIVTRSVCL
jgi:hypothetical protein